MWTSSIGQVNNLGTPETCAFYKLSVSVVYENGSVERIYIYGSIFCRVSLVGQITYNLQATSLWHTDGCGSPKVGIIPRS